MFSFFKKKFLPPPPPVTTPPGASPAAAVPAAPAAPAPAWPGSGGSLIGTALVKPIDIPVAAPVTPERERWIAKLTSGLRKTGSSISSVFTGTQVDDALFEDLESALLMADTGMKATTYLLDEVKRRVRESGVTHPVAVKNILLDALAKLLKPLEQPLVIGQYKPTVIMVAGVNGAGKTTSIGKLTSHLANEGASVLLAAADTFRAAAREQLSIWADRNTVEIISQEGGDPAAVSFDAVSAGRARGKDVVLVDTAGRLPTQLHLMEELKKIKRTIAKAGSSDVREAKSVGASSADRPPLGGAAPSGGSEPHEVGSVGASLPPHEVLLVIDGNTGQNALSQVKSFDDALQLTGLIVTKLDGTAKGGVLAAIALWSRERQEALPDLRPVPVYFIGVGEKLEDLETFNAREFAQALLS
jgi:fused signal recognition particle receptor